jgi:hypothetical protein
VPAPHRQCVLRSASMRGKTRAAQSTWGGC